MTISTRGELEEGTVLERFLVERTVRLLSRENVQRIEFQTGISPCSASLESRSAHELKRDLMPLVVLAAWKMLDFVVELSLVTSGSLRTKELQRIGIEAKKEKADQRKGADLLNNRELWDATCDLYAGTSDIRHSLVHRRSKVDAQGTLLCDDNVGAALTPMTVEEQDAFCKVAHRVVVSAFAGKLERYAQRDLHRHLSVLHRHGVSLPVQAGRHPAFVRHPLRNSRVCVSDLLAESSQKFPDFEWVGIELETPSGILKVDLDEAPTEIVELDLEALPSWLGRLDDGALDGRRRT